MEYRAKDVGTRLRKLRQENRYSRKEIAERIGRSPKYYADIERGICGMSLETLIGLADIYHISLDYLVEGIQPEEKDSVDEEMRWAMMRLGRMEQRRRKVVIEMVNLMVEQAEERQE
jgi:transcriptional regulator with XRE-family HTH domain